MWMAAQFLVEFGAAYAVLFFVGELVDLALRRWQGKGPANARPYFDVIAALC